MNRQGASYKEAESESETESGVTESGSESESDTELIFGPPTQYTYNPKEEHIDHVDALQHWASFIRHKVPKEMFPALGEDTMETAPSNEGGIGVANTKIRFEEQRLTHVIMIDSLDRDQHSYPLPTQMRLKLPRAYKNVERIDIVQVKFFCGLYAISAARKNNSLLVGVGGSQYTVSVPDGTYSLAQLLSTLQTALNTVAVPLTYTVSFNVTTGRVTIAASGTFQLLYTTALRIFNQSAYSEWGLGWVLGWGGQPTDLTGARSYTADHFPRIVDDYIYLQLNDTERMNDVDHTYIENTATAQDSTGQVSHYFGKLLLNTFGSYAQTFIESPKRFTPVLGRLDRLNVTWLDRKGNPFTGPDAASCDWHMTLRITEIVEVPAANSTLTQALQRQ